MTPEQIIQRVRDIHALKAGLSFEDSRDELVMLSAKLADAYDAQARTLAEVEAENVKLREEIGLHSACGEAYDVLKAERDALKAKVAEVVAFLDAIPIQRRSKDRDEWAAWLLNVAQHQAAILKGDQ